MRQETIKKELERKNLSRAQSLQKKLDEGPKFDPNKYEYESSVALTQMEDIIPADPSTAIGKLQQGSNKWWSKMQGK